MVNNNILLLYPFANVIRHFFKPGLEPAPAVVEIQKLKVSGDLSGHHANAGGTGEVYGDLAIGHPSFGERLPWAGWAFVPCSRNRAQSGSDVSRSCCYETFHCSVSFRFQILALIRSAARRAAAIHERHIA